MLVERGAFAEAVPLRRRVLEARERQLGPEHRETLIAVNNLASVLQDLGKFNEAPLMCCAAVTVAGGWCCILCWEKLGKIAGKQQPHFQIISDFAIYIEMRCYMNKSILRKSSQIISNHVMYGRAKTLTCQSLAKLAKDVRKEQMPRCKFQSEMSVKAFLQKNTEQMHPEVGVCLQMEDWNDDDAHPNYVEMSTRRTLRFILQVLNYVCIYMV